MSFSAFSKSDKHTTNNVIPKPKNRRQSLSNFLSRKLSRKCRELSEEDVQYIVANTGLDRSDVESQYRQFLRSHPSGRLNLPSLRNMLAESLPGVDTRGLAAHVWRIYDTNLDGKIDFKEFIMALCVMSSGSAEDNLRQIFRLFDINSDGRVDRSEMGRVVEELNKVGELEDELVTDAFTEMDEDMDGGVTEEEFVKACLHQRKASIKLTLRVIEIFVAG